MSWFGVMYTGPQLIGAIMGNSCPGWYASLHHCHCMLLHCAAMQEAELKMPWERKQAGSRWHSTWRSLTASAGDQNKLASFTLLSGGLHQSGCWGLPPVCKLMDPSSWSSLCMHMSAMQMHGKFQPASPESLGELVGAFHPLRVSPHIMICPCYANWPSRADLCPRSACACTLSSALACSAWSLWNHATI